MAEVGAAALGYAVSKLLDEVLLALRQLKNRPANLLKLQNLLERLQPSVQELNSLVRDDKHPAGKWLMRLSEELGKARDLVKVSGTVNRNIFALYLTSKESLALYGSIQALLQEASAVQLASGMSDQRILIDNGAKILAEMTASQEKLERLLHGLSNLHSTTDIRRTMSELAEEGFSSETSDRPCSSSVQAQGLLPNSACDVPKPQVTFGGDAVANELINHFLNGNYGKWVALWGMGGIGKTFTARKVFHDSRIQRHFFGGVFWLTVSKDQPGPTHLFKQLLEKIKGREFVSQLPENLEAAKSHLKGLLDKDRVLLVLDDVWQNDVLEYLDVLSESKKGVILITTRDQRILRRIINLVEIFEIPPLSSESSWQLFSYHAFRGREGKVSLEVDAVAKKVAEECRGLPLALEVIGSTMADKELVPAQKALGQTTLRVWETALERLRSANYAKTEYEALYLKLQLSVDSLVEQDSRLQDCFFYFAAFPEDDNVSVHRLVMLWIAEGLVQHDAYSSFSAEEEGKVLLGFLVAKSMIEVSKAGSSCRIHDVLRDLAQRNLSRDFSTGEEIQASARKCLYAPGLHISKLSEEWIASGTPSSATRLSLVDNDLRHFPEPEQFDAPHLQSLILSRNASLQSLSPKFFQNLSNLRVLELSRTGIERIHGTLLRRLKSLVLLNLTACKNLQEVSDEIDKLQSLEFLLLHDCPSLQKLPRVKSLRKLKVYCATVPREEPEMDARDGLSRWQSYRPWRARSRQGIPYMLPPNLRRLNLYFLSTAKYLFDASSFGFLEELKLFRREYSPAKEAPSLEHSKQSILKGITELHHLKVLQIQRCYGTQIPALGKLSLLEDLTMDSWHNLAPEPDAYEGEFPSLKKFHIRCPASMEKMFVFHPGTMPKIESLFISMERREHFPISIVELRSLRRLELVSLGQHINDEDLEFIFRQSDCFPHLEYLRIFDFASKQPEPLSNRLPKHIIERQENGKLTIEDD